MTDTLVFDIETSNFFTDPEVGWNNYDALNISVVGVYSYERNAYACFEADEFDALAEWFGGAQRIVGFASNRYDVPVLHLYFQRRRAVPELDLWSKERIDLLETVEHRTGRRISLSKLAEINLGVSKQQHGSDAIRLFREGKIDELKAYCTNDVVLTRQLFDIVTNEHALQIPDGTTGRLRTLTLSNTYGTQTNLF